MTNDSTLVCHSYIFFGEIFVKPFYHFYWYFKFSAILFLIFKNCFLITVHYFVWVFLLILWMHWFLFSLWGYQSMFCFLLKIILLSAFSIFSLNHLFLYLFLSILANSGQCIHVWMLGLSKLIGICVYEQNLSIGGSHHGVTRLKIRFFLFFWQYCVAYGTFPTTQPETESTPPALEDKVLTTVPQGKFPLFLKFV